MGPMPTPTGSDLDRQVTLALTAQKNASFVLVPVLKVPTWPNSVTPAVSNIAVKMPSLIASAGAHGDCK